MTSPRFSVRRIAVISTANKCSWSSSTQDWPPPLIILQIAFVEQYTYFTSLMVNKWNEKNGKKKKKLARSSVEFGFLPKHQHCRSYSFTTATTFDSHNDIVIFIKRLEEDFVHLRRGDSKSVKSYNNDPRKGSKRRYIAARAVHATWYPRRNSIFWH
jgi:hypothetical protein